MPKDSSQDDAEEAAVSPSGTGKKYGNMYYEAESSPPPKAHVNIHDPMFLWLIIIAVAVSIRVLASGGYLPYGTQQYGIGMSFSDFILQFPGIMLLPLLIGAIIGSEIGTRSPTIRRALRGSLINAVYCSVIYAIAMAVIYVVLSSYSMQFYSLYVMLLNGILLPVLVFTVSLTLFSVLSYSRKV